MAGIEEEINAMAVLVDDLRRDNIQTRLNAHRNIYTIATALGEERTREELLPFLKTSLDEEDEVLMVMAEALTNFVDVVGGPSYAYILLDILESLATVDEVSVRDMALQSMSQVVNAMSNDHVITHFVPLIQRLATKDWFTSRIASCKLFAVAYSRVPTATQEQMRSLFRQLCRDDTPMVRKAAAAALGDFVSKMDRENAIADLLPLFLELARDRQDSVRIYTVDNAVVFARIVPLEILTTNVLPTIYETARDNSWRVRWSVANRYPEVCEAIGTDAIGNQFHDCYVALLSDSEAEVRTASVSRAPGVLRFLTSQMIVQRLIPCFQTLATDPSDHVRSALAAVVMQVAPFLGRDMTIEHLLPLFLLLLNDQNSEVRLNVISNVQECNTVIGIDRLAQALLPAIVRLAEDRQWRVRLAIIEYAPLLATQLGREYFEEQLSHLCMSWLSDSVFSIRKAATINLLKLAELFGNEWACTHIIPRIAEMQTSANFLHRLTALHAISILCEAVDPATIQSQFIPLTVGLSQDPVPNIRFNVAKALDVLVSRVDDTTKENAVKSCLTTLASDGDRDVVYFAQQALQKI